MPLGRHPGVRCPAANLPVSAGGDERVCRFHPLHHPDITTLALAATLSEAT
ncbi:MAG TPA: hypothetical protein VF302_11005 [Candidatus Limnocylindrales bacterium]